MAVPVSSSFHCKYCGSIEIANAQLADQHGKGKSFSPSVKIWDVNIGVSINREKSSSISYETQFCKKCYNLHVGGSTTSYDPLMIGLSSRVSLVIPYSLLIVLKTYMYECEGISQLITQNIDKLNKIQKEWSTTGQVPCKRGHVGYKIKLQLKNKVKIMCWVIMDIVEETLVYRLAYGGAKINCP